MSNIKQAIRFMQTAQNPQMAAQTLIQQNPKIVEAVNFVKSMNTDPQTAFYTLAKQKGVDGDVFLRDLLS